MPFLLRHVLEAAVKVTEVMEFDALDLVSHDIMQKNNWFEAEANESYLAVNEYIIVSV